MPTFHDDFLLWCLSDTAYKKLASPLLNRFEKQCVSRSDVLLPLYKKAEEDLWEWCTDVLRVAQTSTPTNLSRGDLCQPMQRVFVGFNSETLASALLSVQEQPGGTLRGLGDVICDVKEMLTRIATPESIVKYSFRNGRGLMGRETAQSTDQFDMAQLYFEKQQHNSLCDFIHFTLDDSMIQPIDPKDSNIGPHAVVMTFSGTSVDLVNSAHLVSPGAQVTIMPKVANLKSFYLGSDFRQAAAKFYGNSANNTLIVHCSLSEVTSAQVHHAKDMCLEERRKIPHLPTLKSVFFLVHLEKDDRPEGMLHSFTYHTEREWQYATVDNIESSAVQLIPDVTTMLTFEFQKLFAGDAQRLLAMKILRTGFRTCLSKIIYPREFGLSIRTHVLLLERLFDRDDEFTLAMMSRVQPIFEESVSDLLETDWQAKLTTQDICGSGTFRKALYHRTELAVHRSFTRVLAAADQCANLALYDSLHSVSLRKLWISCLRNSFVEIPDFARNERGSRSRTLVISSPKRSRPFKADFPFSMLIYYRIEGMRTAATTLAQDDPVHDEWSTLARLVDNSSLAFCIKHVDELDRYVSDAVRIKHLAPSMGQWESEALVTARTIKYENAYLSIAR